MRLFVLAAALMLTPGLAEAALVTYSWSGTVTPAPNQGDPWQLGAVMPYSISISVDGSEPDILSSVSSARFRVFDVDVTINGVAATTLQLGTLTFSDNAVGQFDILQLDDTTIQFNGGSADFDSLAASNTTLFSLTTGFSPPPVFPNRAVSQGGVSTGVYSIVAGGAINVSVNATATPEPASLAIWGMGASGIGLLARRRRSNRPKSPPHD